MSRRDAVVLGSRLMGMLLTVCAIVEVSYLPGSVYSLLHYSDQGSVFSTVALYWRHYYLIALGFLVVRIVGFSLAAGWFYKCGPDVEEFLLPSASTTEP